MRPTTTALLSLALLAGAAPALAQGGSVAAAEAFFREGRALFDAGKFAEACPKLAESHRLDPATGTLLALALCHEGEGKLATAWGEFADAEGRARREGRADREKVATEHATALQRRLSTLTVDVSPEAAAVSGLEVRVDGVVAGAASFGSAVPVDGGEHRVQVSAPGKAPWEGLVTVKPELDAVRVTVPPLVDAPPQTAPVAPVAQPSAAPAAPPPKKGGAWMSTTGLVVAGAGVVAVGVGSYLALDAKSDYDAADEQCNGDVCPPVAFRATEDARSQGTIATVLFVVGGAAVATGAVLWFLAPSGKEEGAVPAAGLRVERVGLGLSGVRLEGTF